jgi:hypothetical protein
MANRSKRYSLYPPQDFFICPKFPVAPGLKRTKLNGLNAKRRNALTGLDLDRAKWLKIYRNCPKGYEDRFVNV